MLNQIVLVGRLIDTPKIEKNEEGISKCIITLEVTRCYKNADGIYETDFIPCILWNGIANNIIEYCKQGDLLGIKGRLQTRQDDNKNIIEVIAEKVTFLSSKKENKED